MPVDIKVTESFKTEWDDVGDIATVRGDKYIQQCIIVGIVEGIGLTPSSLTPTDIEEHRGNIETSVENNHATSTPVDVDIVDISSDQQSVTYAVSTASAEFTVTSA